MGMHQVPKRHAHKCTQSKDGLSVLKKWADLPKSLVPKTSVQA